MPDEPRRHVDLVEHVGLVRRRDRQPEHRPEAGGEDEQPDQRPHQRREEALALVREAQRSRRAMPRERGCPPRPHAGIAAASSPVIARNALGERAVAGDLAPRARPRAPRRGAGRPPGRRRRHLVEHVRRPERRDPLLGDQPPHQRLHLGPRPHVEPGRRLVEQQQLRPVQQRPRDLRPPLLPARERARLHPLAVGEPDQRQHLGDPRPRRPSAEPVQRRVIGRGSARASGRRRAPGSGTRRRAAPAPRPAAAARRSPPPRSGPRCCRRAG